MIRYKIALINVFWSKDDINTRYFDDVATQKTYFDSLIGSNLSAPLNFNMNDNIETIVTYKDESGRDAETLCKTNYAVVIKGDYNKETEVFTEQSRRYYFSYATQDSNGQMRCQLSLDDIQTNFIGHETDITNSLINRCHFDRFKKNNDSTASFLGDYTSKLFEREDIRNISKRLVERKKMKIVSQKNPEIAEFLNKNIACWVYVYLSDGTYNVGGYGTGGLNGTIVSQNLERTKYVNSTISVSTLQEPMTALSGSLTTLCYPIYKLNTSGSILLVNNNTQNLKYWNAPEGFIQFLSENGGWSSKIKSIKLSPIPPFEMETYKYKFSMSGSNLLLYFSQNAFTGNLSLNVESGSSPANETVSIIQSPIAVATTNHPNCSLFYITHQSLTNYLNLELDFDLPNTTFNISEITSGYPYSKFNPKINSMDYKNLTISFFGSTFDFDIQKINSKNPKFKLKEFATPDISKIQITLDSSNSDDIYNDKFSNSFTGLIVTNDLSIPIANNVLDEYLANNKNAYLSFQTRQNYNILSTLVTSTTQLPQGNGLSAVNSIIQGGLKSWHDEAQFNFSIDNMRSAPDQLVNANGSVIFGSGICEFGVYGELYEALDFEQSIANNSMEMYGYSFNHPAVIKALCHTRKRFNYLSANVEIIKSNISNKEKERLRERLKSIRFWHTDSNIGYYGLQNYERSLE